MDLFSKATSQIVKQMTDPMKVLSGFNFGNDNHLNDIKNAIVSNPSEYINDLNKFSIADVAKQNCDEKEKRYRALSSIKGLLPYESLIPLRDILRAHHKTQYNNLCNGNTGENNINNYINLANKIADEIDQNLNTMLGNNPVGRVNGGRKKSRSRPRNRSRGKKSKSKSKRTKSKSKK